MNNQSICCLIVVVDVLKDGKLDQNSHYTAKQVHHHPFKDAFRMYLFLMSARL